MPTWRLELEYEGTRYRGWQIQHNAKTVQGEMMNVARELFSSRVEIGGSGRTDAGVHALQQIAHLRAEDLKANITPKMIREGFNDLLPHDINILKVTNAPDDFDSRRHAVERRYVYQISTRRTAFGKSFVWWIKDQLDVAAMQEAAQLIGGRHDFASFCEVDDDKKKQSTTVVVNHSEVYVDGDIICFRIAASHFLWKMVRRLTGMLVEVGRRNAGVGDFERLLKFKSGAAAQYTAPPSGLYLEKVLYKGETAEMERKAVRLI